MSANYKVEVFFNHSRRRTNYLSAVKTSSYPYCGTNLDTFTFTRWGFVLDATRSSIYQDGTILTNDRNGLYQQIMKGLMVYYALSNDYPILKSVRILRIKLRGPSIVYTETASFKQPIKPGSPRQLFLPVSFADDILQETEKSQTLRIAITYWLKASNSADIYFRFDRFWRAYDRLLLYQGNTTKESVGIPAMKNVISSNENLFTRSKNLTNTIFAPKLRSYSWIVLLSSKTLSYTKSSELSRRLTEYTDQRIIALFSSIAGDRKIQSALSSSGFLPGVNAHFATNATTSKDIDIVLLMSLSYTYFVRCRLFHGEVPDGTFKMKMTKEDIEISELANLMEIVVFELLNSNAILR